MKRNLYKDMAALTNIRMEMQDAKEHYEADVHKYMIDLIDEMLKTVDEEIVAEKTAKNNEHLPGCFSWGCVEGCTYVWKDSSHAELEEKAPSETKIDSQQIIDVLRENVEFWKRQLTEMTRLRDHWKAQAEGHVARIINFRKAMGAL